MKEAVGRSKANVSSTKDRTRVRGAAGGVHPILQLQQQAGNRAVGRMMARRSAANTGIEHAGDAVRRAAGAPGERMDPVSQAFMSSRFGTDFGEVRVHADETAAAASEALGANAYASGQNIYFAAGKYAPQSDHGRRLLAHELAHTIQQRGNAPNPAAQRDTSGHLMIDSDPELERDADRAADQAVSPLHPGATRIEIAGARGGRSAIQRDVAAPLNEDVREPREQRAVAAIRARDYRRLAENDRPLESDFELDWQPLGDPNHVAQLAGHPVLDDLSDSQILGILASDEDHPMPIPVRFSSLAWGTIWVARDELSINTVHPSVIRLDHPALPSLDDAHVPALLVEVYDSMVSGEIVTVSNQLSMGLPGSNFCRIGRSSLDHVLALEDLQHLQIGAIENKLGDGRLAFRATNLTFDLDGVFPGQGRFDIDDENASFKADAEVEAQGVAKAKVAIHRDALGDLDATATLSGNLTPRPGHTLSGELKATFLRGMFDVRGTMVYQSPMVSGEVTVLLTDATRAWQEVRTRLGDKAPLVGASPDAPHGLALVGWGSLDFQLSEWLTGEAEVIVDPDGFVTAIGRIAPTKVIPIFGQRSKRETIFDHKLPTEVGVGATLTAHASIGPAVLGDIVVDGYCTTYDRPGTERPNEFSVRGVLAAPAVAGVELTVQGFAHVGLAGLSVGAHIEATGSAEVQAYATAEPHIGRTRKEDGSAGYFIRGRLTAGAALVLGLTGKAVIDTPWPLPNIPVVNFGHRRWEVGGASVSAHGTYFLGGDATPDLDYHVDKFDPSALVSSLIHHHDSMASGDAAAKSQIEHWDEDVTVHEIEPSRPTPSLPVGEEAIDVDTPTLAQHQLPAFTEVEQDADAPAPTLGPSTTGAPAGPIVAPSVPITAPDPTGGPSTAAPVGPVSSVPPTRPATTPPGVKALVVPFTMEKVDHALYLRAETVPVIWMASLESPLGKRILQTIEIVEDELAEARTRGGISSAGHSAEELGIELDLLDEIQERATQIEAEAFKRSHDIELGIPRDTPNYERIPREPRLPDLAYSIASYAAMCHRADLGREEAANNPPPVVRPHPIDAPAVLRELKDFRVGDPQRVIDNLTTLPAGPEIEEIIVSQIFRGSVGYAKALSQLQSPGELGPTLACFREGRRLHAAGFQIWFEIKGPGQRGAPGYFDVDVAAISPTGPVSQVLAVKRFRGLDALRSNLRDAGDQLRGVGAGEKWAVMHVQYGTSAELHSDYPNVIPGFQAANPGVRVRVFYQGRSAEDF